MRKIKKGQMYLNLWAGWQSVFVVMAIGKECCYGVSLYKVKDEFKLHNSEHNTFDLKNDEEHFKLVGEIDVKAMWVGRILERITPEGRKVIEENYDYNGHRVKCETT